MVPIVKQLCPPSRYGIKCPYTREPRNIVVHNTGNSAPAINEVTYMINRGDEVSFHVAVDDKEIRQGLPFDRNAWASGDGRGRGNMYGIHIEICWSNHNPAATSLTPAQVYEKFAAAERNAAEYIASLLKEYGWGLDRVTKHQDYDGKYCPHRTLDLGWERFLNMVRAELNKLNKPKEEVDMTKEEVKKLVQEESAKAIKAALDKQNTVYNTLEDMPSYWQDDIRALMDKGIIKGTGNGVLGLTYSETKMAVIVKRAMEQK